ncbi:MAG: dolichyl-phosphate beta-glucosyltransferase [Stackebrandtia sp.]
MSAVIPQPSWAPPAPAVLDLSVVVPVYNERRRLCATLREICGHLRATTPGWEVIVVDDGSADGSGELAERIAAACPAVRVLRTPVNRGKGHAVRRGVLASRGRLVLFCDADLATPIAELDRLRERVAAGFDVAVGSRADESSRIEVRQPALREVLGRWGNRVIRAAAVPGIRDTQCGFKLFDGDKARRVFRHAHIDGWGFDVEVLYLYARHGWSVAEVPVRWAHRPGSKLRPHHYLRTLADLIRLRLRHRKACRL